MELYPLKKVKDYTDIFSSGTFILIVALLAICIGLIIFVLIYFLIFLILNVSCIWIIPIGEVKYGKR